MDCKTYLKSCNEVSSTTFDPKSQGVVRLHLVPPENPKPNTPWVVIINGYSVIPLQSSWAILLKEFMARLNETEGKALSDEDVLCVVNDTVKNVRKIFTKANPDDIKSDLIDMVDTFKNIAVGIEPNAEIGYMTLSKYSKFMSAPHRIDLMISAMEKNGCWNCNQNCLHCYAAGEKISAVKELDTEGFKKVIDKCRKARIPAITFTGGEPTLRDDLVELVDYSRWFVTRLNTNGILLSKELCEDLFDASLDSVQVTLYSFDKNIHNTLVGGDHFDQTVEGIKNAVKANLDVSINTPLCSLNTNYLDTVKFAESLGIKYFSCSGLIPSGNAKTDYSAITKLSKNEITEIVKTAYEYTSENDLEIAFTSPGWIDERELRSMKLVVPSCGACLSNMAIAPNGEVLPCQSWLNGLTLGNILEQDWNKIWKSKKCKKIRRTACNVKQTCLLKKEIKL